MFVVLLGPAMTICMALLKSPHFQLVQLSNLIQTCNKYLCSLRSLYRESVSPNCSAKISADSLYRMRMMYEAI